MSWWNANYYFGEDSNESLVPDSYEKPLLPELNEEEVVSGVRSHHKTPLLPDLNEPLPYYEDGGEPSYAQDGGPVYVYGGEHPYAQHGRPYYEYGGEPAYVQQNYSDHVYVSEPWYDEQIKKESVDDEERPYPIVTYETDQDFTSRKELELWAQKRGIDNGYVIVTRRSKKKGENDVKVWLQCNRSGEHKSIATVRKTGSKKTGCPFELIGLYDGTRDVWRLRVSNAEHNHGPSENLEGHAYARRLSPNEYRLVEQLSAQNIPARNIWKTITTQNPESKCLPKDIHNAIQKINAGKGVGESPMVQMEKLLVSKDYTYYTREDPSTNAVEEVFFVHRLSYTMWRAFPHVLIIDATYKTNMYNLPFVQVVGMTSTNRTFAVAHAFVSKEKEENYIWVLEMIKSMLEECMEPRVIITDRDQALMNACDKIFPNAYKYLCRFHIFRNINKRCKKSFTEKEWEQFARSWAALCESATPAIYQYHVSNINKVLLAAGRKHVFDYVNTQWLGPYHEKFVSAWMNRTINFHQTTTNRVESQHADLKRYLTTHNSTLHRLVGFVDDIVEKQYKLIKKSFEESLTKIMNHHKVMPMLDNLRLKVSHKALELIENELHRKLSVLRTYEATCGCQLFMSCGLPCACRLELLENTGRRIQLDSIDVFWKKLDFKASKIKEEEIDLGQEFELLKQQMMSQPKQVKMSMLSKIKQVLNPSKTEKKPPVVQQNTRGRPTVKVQEQRKDDAARNSSFAPSEQSRYDPPRHSSYITSQDSQKPSSVVKPVLRRSRSTASKKGEPRDNHGFPLIIGDESVHDIIRFKKQIPELFRPYISRIKDVKPDGHCGFRSVAVGLGWEQRRFTFIREELVKELVNHQQIWMEIFDSEKEGQYHDLLRMIDFKGVKAAPFEHWMEMPQTGLLIAQRFGVIVHCLSTSGSETFFPLMNGPNNVPIPHRTVSLVFVNADHFIHITLEGEYPMPLPNKLWSANRSDDAAGWYDVYGNRIEWFRAIMNPNPDRNVYILD